MLSALRQGGAAVGILTLLVLSVVQGSADPGGSAATEAAQRHTAPAPAPTTAPDQNAPIRFTAPVDPNPSSLARFYAQHVAWRACRDDDDFDCATVDVPVDHTKPGGATVAISLRRLPSTGERPKGTLFVNPGGPGGSGVDFVQEPAVFGRDLREAWDIVGFDPRGVGESGGFDCLTDDELDAMYAADPTPPSAAGERGLVDAAQERVATCLERGGELARNMGTEAVAADLDILREAVGDERLNYFGVSYGTLIGAVYAQEYTSRVGLMVLDSAVPPDGEDPPQVNQLAVDDNTRHWAAEFDRLFEDFVDACVDDGGCPLGADVDAVGTRIIDLLDSLEQVPLTTDIPSLPQLTEGWAVTALGQGLLDPTSWPYLVDALDAAVADHDGGELAWFAMVAVGRDADGSYPGSSYGKSHLPITCNDWPQSTWDELAPSPAVLESHPLFARVQPPLPAECSGWDGRTRSKLVVRAEPQTPVLVIGNVGDPVTPIADSRDLSDQIIRSRFVSVQAELHGAYAMGNSCADGVVEDYLVKGVAPKDGLRCEAD